MTSWKSAFHHDIRSLNSGMSLINDDRIHRAAYVIMVG